MVSPTTGMALAKLHYPGMIIQELEDGWRDTSESPTINPQGFRRLEQPLKALGLVHPFSDKCKKLNSIKTQGTTLSLRKLWARLNL
ncbi:hypothetical protein A4A49_53431 [Nicotiana attenuata]|uniref:Uncharacterized protein n=1 Tax=Nicotiana attenuata TaxID=49451 RepID=A0A1J6K5H4_NICAT|nr:hypothetical protein A4A49_53431 [Nicotiana attenuata]